MWQCDGVLYLRPGFEHSQRLHGEGAFIIELTGDVSPNLYFGERGSQKLMHPSQVTQLTDDSTGDPCTAYLKGKTKVDVRTQH